MDTKKRRHGDRRDGTLVRDADTMHKFLPFLLPNRCDNEAVMHEQIDLTAIEEYLTHKNADNPEFKYTFFHVICAALAKTIVLRPKMNRFYAGDRMYERNEIIFSFVVKKKFADDGAEALAIVKIDPESDVPPLEQIHSQVEKIVYSVRKKEQIDGTTDKMGDLMKFPRPMLRFVMRTLRWLDYHGWYPKALQYDDPYYSTVFISNLGSIKMNASYHHLTNWGTNSIFLVVGEKKPTPFFNADGSHEMRDALELGFTIDERIADGLYFANSIRILRKLLQEPSLLDESAKAPVTL